VASSVSEVPGQDEISFGACTSAVGVTHASRAVVSRRSHGKKASTSKAWAGVHLLSGSLQLPV
jgi:hypothetical protein